MCMHGNKCACQGGIIRGIDNREGQASGMRKGGRQEMGPVMKRDKEPIAFLAPILSWNFLVVNMCMK